MESNQPKPKSAGRSKAVRYRTSPYAVVLLCAFVAAHIVLVAILLFPGLKEAVWRQLEIMIGMTLVLALPALSFVRRKEAREAQRRARSGEPALSEATPTSSWAIGALLFGGGSAFILWMKLTDERYAGLRGLGYAISFLIVGIWCALEFWKRMRNR